MTIERQPLRSADGVIDALVEFRDEYRHLRAENIELRQRIAKLEETSVQPDLSGAIARMNDVITAQIQAVGTGSGIAKAADIRRRQVAKYPPEHDYAHGSTKLANAAAALVTFTMGLWPWHRQGYEDLVNSPDRLAHAAALCAAAYDVEQAKRKGRT